MEYNNVAICFYHMNIHMMCKTLIFFRAPDYFDEAWRSKIKDEVTNWRVKVFFLIHGVKCNMNKLSFTLS